MIIIIIRLLPPPLHSPPLLRNFTNKEQYSMSGMLWKERNLIYIANHSVNGHTHELGDDATNVISTSGAHSKIIHTKISIAPQPKEG